MKNLKTRVIGLLIAAVIVFSVALSIAPTPQPKESDPGGGTTVNFILPFRFGRY